MWNLKTKRKTKIKKKNNKAKLINRDNTLVTGRGGGWAAG